MQKKMQKKMQKSGKRLIGMCYFCLRYYDDLGEDVEEDLEKFSAHCEAYPEGIPEAVFDSGHLYPKPGDNGLQFKLSAGMKLPEYLNYTQEEEDEKYRYEKEKEASYLHDVY